MHVNNSFKVTTKRKEFNYINSIKEQRKLGEGKIY